MSTNPDHEERLMSKNSIQHPNFGGGFATVNFTYDVMLIQLEREVALSEYVQTICMPGSASDFKDGENCVVSAWGTESRNQAITSNRLKHAIVELQSWEECNGTSSSNVTRG